MVLRSSSWALQQATAFQRPRVPVKGLQVLFPGPAPSAITTDLLTKQLYLFDPSLQTVASRAPLDVDSSAGSQGVASCVTSSAPASQASAEHRVDTILHHNHPLPAPIAEEYITYFFYTQPVKESMADMQGLMCLSYQGTDVFAPLEK
ncbi:hypothetical protein IOCL2690_000638600 [Leishmania lindenbergi]|uniref:Uncharacterized protein n=1 Tax=Leishmania lindenbergi TaxID=651832 RepID=A0AAW3A373_9TRYP